MDQHLQVRLDEARAAIAGPAAASFRDVSLEVTGEAAGLASHFPVAETGVACVGAALIAAAALHRDRGGAALPVSLDRGHVGVALRSEAWFRRGGRPAPAGFAPLSRFWETADGWVRTHANYPWHRGALLRAIGAPEDPEAVGTALAGMAAEEVEASVIAAGGVAAAVRALGDWRAHPQGRALATEPLVARGEIGEARNRERAPADLPAAGVRVLDLTRVIAGPVCTRYLAALGADVVRIDPPRRPDMGRGAVADTLLGKASAVVDLSSRSGLATLHALADQADVVVLGYRPAALARFGLGPEDLAGRHPGLVVVSLD
ncbi:MAG TPA: CoA transferase, partial [Acidimicrobiales bacterium]|nr:CoA transferase [Acidimicrobiales bacterium]